MKSRSVDAKFKSSSPQIHILELFIDLDCFGVSCLVLEISASESGKEIHLKNSTVMSHDPVTQNNYVGWKVVPVSKKVALLTTGIILCNGGHDFYKETLLLKCSNVLREHHI